MLFAIILFGNLVLAEEMAGVVESKANETKTEGNVLTTPGNETESTTMANSENETTMVTNDGTKSEAVSSNETGNATNMEFGFESQQQKDENGDSAPSVIEKAKREVLYNEPEGFEASSLNETGKNVNMLFTFESEEHKNQSQTDLQEHIEAANSEHLGISMEAPVEIESESPTVLATVNPTKVPITVFPTFEPSPSPTLTPSQKPILNPSLSPTPRPTFKPSPRPTFVPSPSPTLKPSLEDTDIPSIEPTPAPISKTPTLIPTPKPSKVTKVPSPSPSQSPTEIPTMTPNTPSPSKAPIPNPSNNPTIEPTSKPTSDPTANRVITTRVTYETPITDFQAAKICEVVATKINATCEAVFFADGNTSRYLEQNTDNTKTYAKVDESSKLCFGHIDPASNPITQNPRYTIEGCAAACKDHDAFSLANAMDDPSTHRRVQNVDGVLYYDCRCCSPDYELKDYQGKTFYTYYTEPVPVSETNTTAVNPSPTNETSGPIKLSTEMKNLDVNFEPSSMNETGQNVHMVFTFNSEDHKMNKSPELPDHIEDASLAHLGTGAFQTPHLMTDPPAPETTPTPTFDPITAMPTPSPTCNPSVRPSSAPFDKPSKIPSKNPSPKPTIRPSKCPTFKPSIKPSAKPTSDPTLTPTIRPVTQSPTNMPSPKPLRPTFVPSPSPTPRPTPDPTPDPTTMKPSFKPSPRPTYNPTPVPTKSPSKEPTVNKEVTTSVTYAMTISKSQASSICNAVANKVNATCNGVVFDKEGSERRLEYTEISGKYVNMIFGLSHKALRTIDVMKLIDVIRMSSIQVAKMSPPKIIFKDAIEMTQIHLISSGDGQENNLVYDLMSDTALLAITLICGILAMYFFLKYRSTLRKQYAESGFDP